MHHKSGLHGSMYIYVCDSQGHRSNRIKVQLSKILLQKNPFSAMFSPFKFDPTDWMQRGNINSWPKTTSSIIIILEINLSSEMFKHRQNRNSPTEIPLFPSIVWLNQLLTFPYAKVQTVQPFMEKTRQI